MTNKFSLKQDAGNNVYFFDACVWQFIFPLSILPNSFTAQEEAYADFYERVLNNDGTIYVNHTLLSEYVNSLIRKYFNYLKEIRSIPSDAQFKKDFRGSTEYLRVANQVASLVKCIVDMDGVEFIEDAKVYKKDLALDLADKIKSSDYNDELFTSMCRSLGLKLVTHDADFKSVKDVHIISNLSKMF